MTRGAKGCLIVLGALIFVFVAVSVALMISGGVPQGSVLRLRIGGEIVEDKDETIFSVLAGEDATLLRDITTAIDRAREDESIVGLVAEIRPFMMGVGKIQEIRDRILAFRESGKFAYVYLQTAGEFSGGNSVYYLATAFEEIWLAPAGAVNLTGFAGVTTFLRGTLDKIGVYPDMDSIGEFKNAKDVYTEKTMTEAHREATTAYLNDWFDQYAEGIALGRGVESGEARRLFVGGPYTAEEALELGLVDSLAYADEFDEELARRLDGEPYLLDLDDYLDRSRSSGGRRIAVITGRGTIITGRSASSPMGEVVMGSDTIVAAFKRAREDRGIKAIIFRVNTPGGAPLGSDLIQRAVRLANREKPVIISMSDYAASGGYWISMGATRIVAHPGTLTGSIGVVAGKLVTTGLYDWIGLNREVIQFGDHATYYYTGTQYTPEQREIYWKFMNRIYDRFTSLVAEDRGKTPEEIDEIGRGRVWTGIRAKDLGLVDELGGMSEAVELAKEEAGIGPDESVRLVYLPKKRTLLEQFLSVDGVRSGGLRLPREIQLVARQLATLALLSNEHVLLLADTPLLAP